MAVEIEGALAFTEADLPAITLETRSYGRYATTDDDSWSWSIDEEDADSALEAVRANLAYWLWLKRNPELVAPVDEAAKADLLSVVEGAEWNDAEGLAELLAREGFRRG